MILVERNHSLSANDSEMITNILKNQHEKWHSGGFLGLLRLVGFLDFVCILGLNSVEF